RRRHTRSKRDWSSDVCSSDLATAPQLPDDNRFLVVTVPVRTDQARNLRPSEVFREVRRHVAAVLFPVDEDVDADFFLEPDPLARRFLLQVPQRVGGELSLRGLGARAG